LNSRLEPDFEKKGGNSMLPPFCDLKGNVTNSSIPTQTRNLTRYALEIGDPFLAQLVRRVEAGEMTIDHLYRE
jgi:hypothetical protein